MSNIVSGLKGANKKIKTLSENLTRRIVPFSPYIQTFFKESSFIKIGNSYLCGGVENIDRLSISDHHELVSTGQNGDISVYNNGQNVGFLPVRAKKGDTRFVAGGSFRIDNQGHYTDFNGLKLLGYKVVDGSKSSELTEVNIPRISHGRATSAVKFSDANLKSDIEVFKGAGQPLRINTNSSLNGNVGKKDLIVPESGTFGRLRPGDQLKINIGSPDVEYICEYGGVVSSCRIGDTSKGSTMCGIKDASDTFLHYNEKDANGEYINIEPGHKLSVNVNGNVTNLEFSREVSNSNDNRFNNLNSLAKKLNEIDEVIAAVRGSGENAQLHVGLKNGTGKLTFADIGGGFFKKELNLEDIDTGENKIVFNSFNSLKSQLLKEKGIRADFKNSGLEISTKSASSSIKFSGIAKEDITAWKFTTENDSNLLIIEADKLNYRSGDVIMFSKSVDKNGLKIEPNIPYAVSKVDGKLTYVQVNGQATSTGNLDIDGAEINGLGLLLKALSLKYDTGSILNGQKNTYNPQGGKSGPNMSEGKITFSEANSTYRFSLQVNDSLNETHIINFGFLKKDTGLWAVEIFADNDELEIKRPNEDGQIAFGDISFDEKGKVSNCDESLKNIKLRWSNKAEEQAIEVDFSSFSQIARGFSMGIVNNNGVRASNSEQVKIRKDGALEVNYSSGDSEIVSYIPVIYFAAANELEYDGLTYTPSEKSGQPVYSSPEEIGAMIEDGTALMLKEDQEDIMKVMEAKQFGEYTAVVAKSEFELNHFLLQHLA